MVMAMRHGVLPKTLHASAPSTQVDWANGAVELLTERRAWPETGRPRRAGVSAFGIGGSNAHMILEQAPPVEAAAETSDVAAVGGLPFVLSGKSEVGLRGQARKLLALVSDDPDISSADVALSLVSTRSMFSHRAVVVGENRAELLAGLAAVVAGQPAAGVMRGVVSGELKVALLFAGQGPQRLGMGRELAARFPVFAAALDEVLAVLDTELERPLRGMLFAKAGSVEAGVDERAYAQQALFAVEVALFRLVQSWGVVPDFVAGQSVGEISAAYVAGVFSLEDACRLVVARARLGHGSPPLMEPMLAEFGLVVEGMRFVDPVIPMVSMATGSLVSAGALSVPGYWVSQVGAGRFADGTSALKAVGVGVGVTAELGADGVVSIMSAMGQLHVAGLGVDWCAVLAGLSARQVELPTYAFQRERFWPSMPPAVSAVE
jgi:acyl transferase domain-containing protein